MKGTRWVLRRERRSNPPDLSDVTSDGSQVDIDNEEILIQNAVYFNSSVENEGIGTQENPYKYLSCDKIVNDSIIYIADGEYTIDKSISVNNLTIIGQSSSKTIINSNAFKLSSNGDLSITSLTLNNFTVENSKNLKVLDVNFKNNNINGSGGAINIIVVCKFNFNFFNMMKKLFGIQLFH